MVQKCNTFYKLKSKKWAFIFICLVLKILYRIFAYSKINTKRFSNNFGFIWLGLRQQIKACCLTKIQNSIGIFGAVFFVKTYRRTPIRRMTNMYHPKSFYRKRSVAPIPLVKNRDIIMIFSHVVAAPFS